MFSQSQLYQIWRQRLSELMPDKRYVQYRLTNFLWLTVGIYLAANIHLSYVVRKLPLRVQKLSLERRFRRFLDNPGIKVRQWYHPVMLDLLRAAKQGDGIHLIIDCTQIGAQFQLVMVAVAHRRRALPLAWMWIPKGHSSQDQQIRLLTYINRWIDEVDPLVPVTLVGDTEFGGTKLIQKLQRWGWRYALHQSSSTYFKPGDSLSWRTFGEAGLTKGFQLWLVQGNLTRSQAIRSNLLLCWGEQYDHPWYLATNFNSARDTLRHYKRRMWIEELFGDLKGHGFDLCDSRLGTQQRLDRLTLIVCLLYLWIVEMGEQVIRRQQVAWVDRSDRRDLSIFRLGWDWIERRLALNDPLPTSFVPQILKVSGS